MNVIVIENVEVFAVTYDNENLKTLITNTVTKSKLSVFIKESHLLDDEIETACFEKLDRRNLL